MIDSIESPLWKLITWRPKKFFCMFMKLLLCMHCLLFVFEWTAK